MKLEKGKKKNSSSLLLLLYNMNKRLMNNYWLMSTSLIKKGEEEHLDSCFINIDNKTYRLISYIIYYRGKKNSSQTLCSISMENINENNNYFFNLYAWINKKVLFLMNNKQFFFLFPKTKKRRMR